MPTLFGVKAGEKFSKWEPKAKFFNIQLRPHLKAGDMVS